MTPMSCNEIQTIDVQIEPMMDWAKSRQAEAEQLALDATRLMACTSERFDNLKKQGFFKRCWNYFSGKNSEITRANVNDLIQMQKVAFRYVNMLQERELILAHALLSLKSNLVSLAVRDAETRELVGMLAQRTAERFDKLENRVEQLEITTNLQGWLLGLEEREYDKKYPTQYMRLFRVINDFFSLKNDNWNYNDLIFMKKAIRTVGLNPKQKISMNAFIENLTEEIQSSDVGFDSYSQSISMFSPDGIDSYSKFIIDNISSPVFVGMHCVKTQFMDRMDVVETLEEEMNITKNEALKMLLNRAIANLNVDMQHELELYDIAIEIITSLRLSNLLIQHKYSQCDVDESEESKVGIADDSKEIQDNTHEKHEDANEVFKFGDYVYDMGKYRIGSWEWTQIKPKGKEECEKIFSVAYFNNRFYFLAEDAIYESEDFKQFNISFVYEHEKYCSGFLRGDKLIVFDNKLIATDGIRGVIYTEDCKNWTKFPFPYGFNGYSQKDVFLFNDKIVFLGTKYTTYDYIVSGMIWDSTKSTSCDKPIILYGSSLSDLDVNNIASDWRRYEYSYDSWHYELDGKLIFELKDCVDRDKLYICSNDCGIWKEMKQQDLTMSSDVRYKLVKFMKWLNWGEDADAEIPKEEIESADTCDLIKMLYPSQAMFVNGNNYIVFCDGDKIGYAPMTDVT